MALHELEEKKRKVENEIRQLESSLKNDTVILDKEKMLQEIRQKNIAKLSTAIENNTLTLEKAKEELTQLDLKITDLKKDELETTTDPEKLRDMAKILKKQLEDEKNKNKLAEEKRKAENKKEGFFSRLFRHKDKEKKEKEKNKDTKNNNETKDLKSIAKNLKQSPEQLLEKTHSNVSATPQKAKNTKQVSNIKKGKKAVNKSPNVKKEVKKKTKNKTLKK